MRGTGAACWSSTGVRGWRGGSAGGSWGTGHWCRASLATALPAAAHAAVPGTAPAVWRLCPRSAQGAAWLVVQCLSQQELGTIHQLIPSARFQQGQRPFPFLGYAAMGKGCLAPGWGFARRHGDIPLGLPRGCTTRSKQPKHRFSLSSPEHGWKPLTGCANKWAQRERKRPGSRPGLRRVGRGCRAPAAGYAGRAGSVPEPAWSWGAGLGHRDLTWRGQLWGGSSSPGAHAPRHSGCAAAQPCAGTEQRELRPVPSIAVMELGGWARGGWCWPCCLAGHRQWARGSSSSSEVNNRCFLWTWCVLCH